MPNWAQNHVTFTSDNEELITRIGESFTRGTLFHDFIPIPATVEEENIRAWVHANWGTKWDVGGPEEDPPVRNGNSITLTFNSAWTPPLEAYDFFLVELRMNVVGYYYEPGMQFAGIYENGNHSEYEEWGDSNGAEATLPKELNEIFGIAESQEIWEESD
jgi:hypothetical protein